jgi:hypothetical protein
VVDPASLLAVMLRVWFLAVPAVGVPDDVAVTPKNTKQMRFVARNGRRVPTTRSHNCCDADKSGGKTPGSPEAPSLSPLQQEIAIRLRRSRKQHSSG